MSVRSRMIRATRPDAPAVGKMPRGVAARLVLNLVLGVVALWWLRTYTDLGDMVTTLLALGGILSWVAVVAKVFTAERQEQIRRCLAGLLFESRKAWLVTLGLAAFLAATLFVGVVEVQNVQGGDAFVRVYPAGNPPPPLDAADRVVVGGRVRSSEAVWPCGEVRRTVKITGLPHQVFSVRAWWDGGPQRVVVPASFVAPIVWVGDQSLLDPNGWQGVTFTVAVVVNKQPVTPDELNYDRKAIIFGPYDPDDIDELVALSEPLRNFQKGLKPPVQAKSLFPVKSIPYALKAGDVVHAELRKGGDVMYRTPPIRVRALDSRAANLTVSTFERATP